MSPSLKFCREHNRTRSIISKIRTDEMKSTHQGWIFSTHMSGFLSGGVPHVHDVSHWMENFFLFFLFFLLFFPFSWIVTFHISFDSVNVLVFMLLHIVCELTTSVHLITVHLITVHLITVHLITVHLITVHLITVHLISLHLISLHLITLHLITPGRRNALTRANITFYLFSWFYTRKKTTKKRPRNDQENVHNSWISDFNPTLWWLLCQLKELCFRIREWSIAYSLIISIDRVIIDWLTYWHIQAADSKLSSINLTSSEFIYTSWVRGWSWSWGRDSNEVSL